MWAKKLKVPGKEICLQRGWRGGSDGLPGVTNRTEFGGNGCFLSFFIEKKGPLQPEKFRFGLLPSGARPLLLFVRLPFLFSKGLVLAERRLHSFAKAEASVAQFFEFGPRYADVAVVLVKADTPPTTSGANVNPTNRGRRPAVVTRGWHVGTVEFDVAAQAVTLFGGGQGHGAMVGQTKERDGHGYILTRDALSLGGG